MKSLNHSELYKDYNLNKDERKNNAEANDCSRNDKSVGGEIWYT